MDKVKTNVILLTSYGIAVTKLQAEKYGRYVDRMDNDGRSDYILDIQEYLSGNNEDDYLEYFDEYITREELEEFEAFTGQNGCDVKDLILEAMDNGEIEFNMYNF